MTSFFDYTLRYCDPKVTRYEALDCTGSTCIDELNYLLMKTTMVRRLKRDILHELPSKTRQKIPVNLDKTIHKEIMGIMKTHFKKEKDIHDIID